MKYYLVKIFLIAITSMSAFGANKKKSEVFKYVLIDLDIVDSHKITRIKLNASIPYKKDIPESPYSNFHLSVTCKFLDMKQLANDQSHSLHQEFTAWLKTVLTARSCVDY